MNECFGKKFILNGKIESSELFENSMVYEGDSIYEVIRMVRGIPVFFNDHFQRLESSVMLQNKAMLASKKELHRDLINITKSDRKKESNIKIVFNYLNGESNYLVYFIEAIYPSEDQYRNGVKGILFQAERKDPASKVIYHKLRSAISNRLIHEGGYEALLVNENGCITEGSRSNVFFLKDDKLFTAPDDLVLSGITRKYILEICKIEGIDVVFECIEADKISEYEAVFMTGTSPMVLPFNMIDNIKFKVRFPLFENLRKLYLLKVEESLMNFKHE